MFRTRGLLRRQAVQGGKRGSQSLATCSFLLLACCYQEVSTGKIPPRDRGNRRTDSKRPSRPPGPVHGAVGLVQRITNDSKHAARHAACKTGACTRALRQSRGLGRTQHPVAVPGGRMLRADQNSGSKARPHRPALWCSHAAVHSHLPPALIQSSFLEYRAMFRNTERTFAGP